MTSGDTKKNLNAEVETANEAEISEETLEEMGGGIGLYSNSYYNRLPGMPRKPRKLEKPEEPTDGGATGSW